MARDHIPVPMMPGPWDVDEVHFHARGCDMVAEKGWSETTDPNGDRGHWQP